MEIPPGGLRCRPLSGDAPHVEASRARGICLYGRGGTAIRLPRLKGKGTDKPEAQMPDDPKIRGPQDRTRVNLHQEHEVRYWTKTLGVSKEQLEAIVGRVG